MPLNCSYIITNEIFQCTASICCRHTLYLLTYTQFYLSHACRQVSVCVVFNTALTVQRCSEHIDIINTSKFSFLYITDTLDVSVPVCTNIVPSEQTPVSSGASDNSLLTESADINSPTLLNTTQLFINVFITIFSFQGIFNIIHAQTVPPFIMECPGIFSVFFLRFQEREKHLMKVMLRNKLGRNLNKTTIMAEKCLPDLQPGIKEGRDAEM